MKTNYTKTEEKINCLISSGKIKNTEELYDISINKLYEKYQLCVDDVLYCFCYKKNGGKCIHNCNTNNSINMPKE